MNEINENQGYRQVGQKGQIQLQSGEVLYWTVIGDMDEVSLSNGHEGYMRPDGSIMITD